ncbi:MAG TPA: arabinose ABC transporter substrate-binding protein [Armatimonadota bacterium]|jgi:L-arabinose transport system substrate-binding protein
MRTIIRSRSALTRKLTRRECLGAAGLLLLLPGCTQQTSPGASTKAPKSPGDVTLGFLVKKPEEPWFQNEWKFADRCAAKYGFKLVKIGAEDGEKVLSGIDNLASQGANGFVICTPDVSLGPAILTKAGQHGMKVFTVDDQLVGSDGKFLDVPYMGISARDIGHQVGKALADEYKKRGWTPADTAACAVTSEELNTFKERTDGAIDEVLKAGFPKDRIFKAPEKTTDVPGSMDAADVLLTQHADVKRWLVFSGNDEGVLGAVRAMETRRFTPDNVIGVGIGGTSALPEFDKPGPTGFFATVLISPLRHGFETTELLYKWVTTGKEPPKDTRTKGILVFRDTCRKVMKEQGLI